jgi:hypothetical protein
MGLCPHVSIKMKHEGKTDINLSVCVTLSSGSDDEAIVEVKDGCSADGTMCQRCVQRFHAAGVVKHCSVRREAVARQIYTDMYHCNLSKVVERRSSGSNVRPRSAAEADRCTYLSPKLSSRLNIPPAPRMAMLFWKGLSLIGVTFALNI